MRGLSAKQEQALDTAVKSATQKAAKTVDENFAQAPHTECGSAFHRSLMKTCKSTWEKTHNLDASVKAIEEKVLLLQKENGKLVGRAIQRHNNPQYTPQLYGEPKREEEKINILTTSVSSAERVWIQVTKQQISVFLSHLLPELQNVKEHFSTATYKEALEANFEQLETDLQAETDKGS